MFKNDTVFILGAGASWHYGYPTGEDLVRQVLERAQRFANYCRDQIGPPNWQVPQFMREPGVTQTEASVKADWERAFRTSEDLVQRLKAADPLVIDYFLGQNPQLAQLGKFLIAWCILACEQQYARTGRNKNREGGRIEIFPKDNWYRFLVSKLSSNCIEPSDLLENRVTFVTFNYDVSLEIGLYQGLRALSLFDGPHVSQFLDSSRIIHVYGQINQRPFPILGHGIDFETLERDGTERDPHKLFDLQRRRFEAMNTVDAAAAGIRVIDPHSKELDVEAIQLSRARIKEASCVFILGYGFDQNNSKRLALDESLSMATSKHGKAIMFTNMGNINRVNKLASNLLYGAHDEFLDSYTHGAPEGEYYSEKSVRNVYDALSLDFDALEERLIAGSKI